MGENPARCFGDTEQIQKALSNIEFLIVQDILNNEMCKYADVVLPGASYLEKEGSFINLEGKRQFFNAIQKPPGESKRDLDILDLLYSDLTGKKADNNCYESILQEINRLAPYPAKMETSQIALSPVTPIKKSRPLEKKGQFAAMGIPTYPQLGSGTRTSHSKRIQVLDNGYHVRVSPDDSEHMKMKNGDLVQLQSDINTVQAHVAIDQDVPQGMLLIPLGQGDNQTAGLFKKHGYHSFETIRISKL